MLTSKLQSIDNSLSVTSRGVLKFQRIDKIKDSFNYNTNYFHPVITDDADWAIMWFVHNKPFLESDGREHWPINLIVYSDILDVHIKIEREEVRKIWDKYVFENILCLHSILSLIDPEWNK